MKNNLAKNLVALRKEKELSQKDIAKICNTTFQTISRWENGTNEPDIDTLILLSGFFGVTIDELIKN